MKSGRGDGSLSTGTPPALLAAPGFLARRIYQAYVASWTYAVDATLTGAQFAVLVALNDYPGVDQGTLAALVSLDRSTMADIARRMEERGLIVREVDEADTRRRLLDLTPLGRETLESTNAKARQLDEMLLIDRLPAERRQIMETLQSLSDRWDALARDLAP